MCGHVEGKAEERVEVEVEEEDPDLDEHLSNVIII